MKAPSTEGFFMGPEPRKEVSHGNSKEEGGGKEARSQEGQEGRSPQEEVRGGCWGRGFSPSNLFSVYHEWMPLPATPAFNVSWLADQLTELEYRNDDEVGLIGCFALLASEQVLARLQHAFKAAGFTDNVTKNSWAGILLIQSKRVPEGCITALAPVEQTFEGMLALLEKVLNLYPGAILVDASGRARVIRLT